MASKNTQKTSYLDPTKLTGDTTSVVRTILSMKAKDFPEPKVVLNIMRQMKVEADQRAMVLVSYLYAYEKSGLWRNTSVPCSNFDGWLDYYKTSLPSVVNYRNGITAILELGVDTCTQLGFKPMVAVVSHLPKEHRAPFINSTLVPGAQTRAFPPSETVALGLIKTYRRVEGLKGPPRVPKSDLVLELEKAQETIRDLKVENRDLKVENRALRKERDALAKRLAQFTKPKR